MTKKMLIDATHAEETRVVVVDGTKVEEFDFESLNKRQLAGNIYLAKVTRVEPSLQAAFVDYGGNRHGFLAFSEIHPDYYQIPKADREALLREEAEAAREEEEAAAKPKPRGRTRSRKPSQPLAEGSGAAEDAVIASEAVEAEPGQPDAEHGPDAFGDAPPPSAAGGEIDITVVPEPGEAPREAEAEGEYESVGGDDVAEERSAPRRQSRARRYKIQEVVKVRQILLVQVVKEERGNKGAALTTYLSLAGRYCVLMPNTARGGGISRKITNAADRKKLKEISSSITVPEGAGLIIRTAGAARTKTEIRRDYEFLIRQWEQIRELTLKSIAPAPIYEEGSLIKRAIRDLYSREMDEILVDGERGYREAKDYMKMLMPSHAKNVKHYAEQTPLFSKFQVESYLSAMFNPVVQLKSGGYIVIDVTEALVAIDVNSGRATREASIEDTALKTNLEAAEEAARQMRLRDLAGLIVIDFIDMEDRRNNAAVEKRLKDKLKSDRARIQLGRISGFGLMEMSRQRLRPGMIEATTKPCPHCHGTGLVRSDDSLALALLREVEEEGVRQRCKEVLIVAPVDIANYLLNQKREHVAMIELRFGLSVRVEGDASLISPDYRIERFKTASRIVPVAPTLGLPKVAYPEIEEEEPEVEEEDEVEVAEAAETGREAGREAASGEEANGEKGNGKRRRRRRRRGGLGRGEGENAQGDEDEGSEPGAAEAPAGEGEAAPVAAQAEPEAPAERGRSRRRSRGGRSGETPAESAEAPETQAEAAPARSAFGEVIDLGETASELVEVPEANAAPRRGRPRVRVPVASVIAPEAMSAPEAVSETASEEAPQVETAQAEAPQAEWTPQAETSQSDWAPQVEEPPVQEPQAEWTPQVEASRTEEPQADWAPQAEVSEPAFEPVSEPVASEPQASESSVEPEAPAFVEPEAESFVEPEAAAFDTFADAQAAAQAPEQDVAPAAEVAPQPESPAEPLTEALSEEAPAPSQEAWSQEPEAPTEAPPAEAETAETMPEPEPLEPAGAESDRTEAAPAAPKRQGWWSRS
jgi:ribonuclease E